MVRSISFALVLSLVACSVMCCNDDSDANGGSSGFSGTDGSFDGATGDGSSAPDDATTDSSVPAGMLLPVSQEAYLKASNSAFETSFGDSVALSADGTTLAVGGPGDSSAASGIGADQTPGGAVQSGAVYIFRRVGTAWSQEVFIKPSNNRASAFFGTVALSADGNTLAAGAYGESSSSAGVDGSQAEGGLSGAGAVYLFSRSGTTWTQTHYLKASKPATNAYFGLRISLSAAGATLAVGSRGEATNLTGINPDEADAAPGAAYQAGAAYVFALVGTTWSQQAFIKASNAAAATQFGYDVSLSADGNSLAVGSPYEAGASTGINGTTPGSIARSGAAYTFKRAGTTWTQEAYVKASNPKVGSNFGTSVSFSADGATLAVGASGETSSAKGIGDPADADTSALEAGAAYVFTHAGGTWAQQVFVKPSNTRASISSYFGSTITLSGDGSTLVVGAYGDESDATGIDGNQTDLSAGVSGAAFAFFRAGATWSQVSYIKASNTRASADFGTGLALSANASTLVVGAPGDSSKGTGVNADQTDTSASAAGAVYAFQ